MRLTVDRQTDGTHLLKIPTVTKIHMIGTDLRVRPGLGLQTNRGSLKSWPIKGLEVCNTSVSVLSRVLTRQVPLTGYGGPTYGGRSTHGDRRYRVSPAQLSRHSLASAEKSPLAKGNPSMTSPFRIFRKHGKWMMAVFTVLLMGSWGVLGVLDDVLGRRGPQQDGVVASTNYGALKDSDIMQLRARRQLARYFMLRAKAAMFGPQMESQALNFFQNEVVQMFGSVSDRALVEDWVIGQKASPLGIAINDDVITQFIRTETNDRVPGERLNQIVQQLPDFGGVRASRSAVYEALRHELSIRYVRDLSFGSVDLSPAQRFEYYQRMRRQAKVELIPIEAESLLSDVREPKDTELREFYNKYKNDEPQLGSPDPGFKSPQKAEFAYLSATYEKFVDPSKVTDAEIAEHYEKFKDQRYLFTTLEDDPEGDKKRAEEEAAKAAELKKAEEAKKKADEAKKAAEPKPDPKPATPSPMPTPTKTEAPKPAEPKVPVAPRDEPTPPATPAPKADPKPAAPPPSPAPTKTDEDKKPSGECVEEQPKDDAEKKAPEATPPAKTEDASKANDTTKASAPAKSTDATKAADSKEAVTPAATEKPFEPKKIPEAPLPLVERFTIERDIKQGANPKHDPLWKVKDRIRREVADEHATKKIQELLSGLDSQLRDYATQRATWELEKQAVKQSTDKVAPEPAMPDFAKKCQELNGSSGIENGLGFGRTGLLTPFELSKYPGLGDSTVNQRDPFVAYAFRQVRVNSVGSSQDIGGNRYVFLKLREEAARVPELDEIRSLVTRTWKLTQARELLQKKAQLLVEKARAANKPLKELFADDKNLKVLEPPTFSWLNRGPAGGFNQQAAPRLSEVEGVVDGGDEFMRGVFALQKDGEVGVTMNRPKSIAYVVRVGNFSPADVVLLETFRFDNPQEIRMAALPDMQQQYRSWLDSQTKAANLKWEKEPGEEESFDM